MSLRIGLGHDTHRLEEGSALHIGGVTIPYSKKLVGHSDADVLIHAIIDAILGATGLPDIGELFSNTDEKNKNRNSLEFLREIELLINDKWSIINIDSIIFAEQPKMAPYKEQMRNEIATVLHLRPEQVGIKAKTGEHIGIIGRKEAIAAQAIVLMECDR